MGLRVHNGRAHPRSCWGRPDARPGGMCTSPPTLTREQMLRRCTSRIWEAIASDNAGALIGAIVDGANDARASPEDFASKLECWLFAEPPREPRGAWRGGVWTRASPPPTEDTAGPPAPHCATPRSCFTPRGVIWAAACSTGAGSCPGGATACLGAMLNFFEPGSEPCSGDRVISAYYQAMLMGRREAARILLPHAAMHDWALGEWDSSALESPAPPGDALPAWRVPVDASWADPGESEALCAGTKVLDWEAGGPSVRVTWPGGYTFTPWVPP